MKPGSITKRTLHIALIVGSIIPLFLFRTECHKKTRTLFVCLFVFWIWPWVYFNFPTVWNLMHCVNNRMCIAFIAEVFSIIVRPELVPVSPEWRDWHSKI